MKPGYKQTDVGVIPEEWQVKRLGELSEFITSGSRGWAAYYSETGALFIRSQNVRDGTLSFEDTQYVRPPSGAEGNRTKVNRNDLLITITGNSVGNVALVEHEFAETYISQHVGLVRLSKPEVGRYISRFLSPNSLGNRQIAGSQSGQSKPGLNLQNLRDFWIALPPLPEQRAIAEALSDVDALLGALDRLIAKKRDLKQAAMQQLLTGQTRLPGFDGEWVVKILSEVCWFQEGPGVRNTQFTASGIKLLNGTNIFRGVLNLDTTTRFISEKEGRGAYAHFLADEGDLVLASSGITIERLHEKVAFVSEQDLPFCMNTSTIRFKPFAGVLAPTFLFQFLTSDSFKRMIGGVATGSAQLNFGPSHVAKVELSVPPLPEQTAIAAVLSDMDAELAALEQRREKTRALKQAMMQELLTGRTRLL